MTDFQLQLIDILTTPDEEYERHTEEVEDEDMFEFFNEPEKYD